MTSNSKNIDTPVWNSYLQAKKRNKMAVYNSMMIPNAHYTQSRLPGGSDSSTKLLKRLKRMYTPNEFTHFTKSFTGRKLDPKTGLPKPITGRGGVTKKNVDDEKGRATRRRNNRIIVKFLIIIK